MNTQPNPDFEFFASITTHIHSEFINLDESWTAAKPEQSFDHSFFMPERPHQNFDQPFLAPARPDQSFDHSFSVRE